MNICAFAGVLNYRMHGATIKILSGTFLVLRRNERVTIISAYWCSSKYPVLLSNINET